MSTQNLYHIFYIYLSRWRRCQMEIYWCKQEIYCLCCFERIIIFWSIFVLMPNIKLNLRRNNWHCSSKWHGNLFAFHIVKQLANAKHRSDVSISTWKRRHWNSNVLFRLYVGTCRTMWLNCWGTMNSLWKLIRHHFGITDDASVFVKRHRYQQVLIVYHVIAFRNSLLRFSDDRSDLQIAIASEYASECIQHTKSINR